MDEQEFDSRKTGDERKLRNQLEKIYLKKQSVYGPVQG